MHTITYHYSRSQLQLSNGQKICFDKRWLQEAENDKEIEIAVDEAPLNFTQALLASNMTTSLLSDATVCVKRKRIPAGSSSNRAFMMLSFLILVASISCMSILKYTEKLDNENYKEGGSGGLASAAEGISSSLPEKVTATLFAATVPVLNPSPSSSAINQLVLMLFSFVSVAVMASLSRAQHAFEVTILKLEVDEAEDEGDSDDEEEKVRRRKGGIGGGGTFERSSLPY